MLVLSRKPGEKVYIGVVTLQVLAVQGQRVRLGIAAPQEVAILRGELTRTPAGAPPNSQPSAAGPV